MATLSIAVQFGDRSYDGPFDALFSLIRYHDYPIDALPVARLTADFLAYIRRAEDLDEDLGGEFMEVASWLVLLKSRSILPADAGTDAQRAPQEELQKALVDRGLIAAVTEDLKERSGTKPALPLKVSVGRAPDAEADPEPRNRELTAGAALDAAEQAIALARTIRYAQKTESLSVEEAQSLILRELGELPCQTAVSAERWLSVQSDEESRAALLLGLLELARNRRILIHQHGPGSAILVKAFSGELPCAEQGAAQGDEQGAGAPLI